MLVLIICDPFSLCCYDMFAETSRGWQMAPWGCFGDSLPGAFLDFSLRQFDDGLSAEGKRVAPARWWDGSHLDFYSFPLI